jgi:hypothetical protein
MAGANKSNSLKAKKRKIQDQDKTIKAAAEKKRRFTGWQPRSDTETSR